MTYVLMSKDKKYYIERYYLDRYRAIDKVSKVYHNYAKIYCSGALTFDSEKDIEFFKKINKTIDLNKWEFTKL